jgi:hypothetical protein
VMQFYSGPLMHFLSGVDNSGCRDAAGDTTHALLIPKRYLSGHEEVLDGIGMPTHANSIAIGPAAARKATGLRSTV